MIPFKQIPANIRVPLFYAELDNSQANSASVVQRTLIIGQMTSSGTGVDGVPVISQGVGDAATVGGYGSMLHLMTDAYRQNDTFGEVWYLPLADNAGGTTAVGSINITHVATAPGVLSLYVGGVKLALTVTTSQTAAQIATALAALAAVTPLLPVVAAVDGVTTSKVNFTARHKGEAGNDVDIRLNYLGTAGGEATPAGITTTIVQSTGGTLNPVLTTGLTNLSSKPFDFVICPFNDTTSLAALKAFMDDSTGRWAWSQQIYGHVFCALRGTYGSLTTYGGAQNDQHRSTLGFYDSPSPSWLWVAAYTASAAVALRNDPALPLQTVAFKGVLPPPTQSVFTLTQNNALLYTGVSTFNVLPDGSLSLQNVVTNYLINAFAQPDDSYLEVETLFTLMAVIRFLSIRVTTKFARCKLAANGTRIAPGSAIVTPNIIRADQIAAFRELEDRGLVQGADAFAANILVQQNASNPNRVDVLWPGTLINQLRVFALLAQFRLKL